MEIKLHSYMNLQYTGNRNISLLCCVNTILFERNYNWNPKNFINQFVNNGTNNGTE